MLDLSCSSHKTLVTIDKLTECYNNLLRGERLKAQSQAPLQCQCSPTPTVGMSKTQCRMMQEYIRCYFGSFYPGLHSSRQLTGLDHVFDSYMVPLSDLKTGDLRLLEVTQHLVVPINTRIRLIVTSADVLHSWAVPSLGIKIDACPGRLNQVSTKIFRRCILYGQCSEICGVNHAFMPIKVEAASISSYRKYVWQNYTAGLPRLV